VRFLVKECFLLLLLPCPQVPIFACLSKFDGSTINDDIRQGRRKFRVTRLPNFLQ
jgi:hypothetical protein